MARENKVLSGLAKFILFLSSYSVLFLILAIKYHEHSKFLFGVISGIILLVVFLLITLHIIEDSGDTPLSVNRVNNLGSESLAYFMTYLLPFLTSDTPSIEELFIFLILFIVIAHFYITSDMIYLNPTLSLFGYRLYKITTLQNEEKIVITKKSINELDQGMYYAIDGGILVGR